MEGVSSSRGPVIVKRGSWGGGFPTISLGMAPAARTFEGRSRRHVLHWRDGSQEAMRCSVG